MTTPTLTTLLAECRELLEEQEAVDKCRKTDHLRDYLSVDRRLAAKVPLLMERLEAVEKLAQLHVLCNGVPLDSLKRALEGEK